LEQRRCKLLVRVHRHYRTTTSRVNLTPVAFDFTRIANPDAVLDQVAAEEDRRERQRGRRLAEGELHLPYWAELWDSALGIGQYLVRRGDEIARPVSVLDLGCGMGLAGTVAAALGHRVLFADLEPPALLFASLNSLPWRDRARTRRVNWRTDDLRERFELIIGADIVYEKAQWEHLDWFWRLHLAHDGIVLLGEPGRQSGELFVAWINERGWELEETEEKVTTRPRPIRIFRLKQKSSPAMQ
jgi:predicted nicotinamide N-methyase